MSEELKQLNAFLEEYPDIELFEVILPDLNGKLRGKWLPRAKIETAFAGGLKLPLTTLAFDVWGRDVESWVFDNGDVDGICEADARTLARVPWLERPTGQVLLSLHDVSGAPCEYDPRSIVKKLMARFQKLGLPLLVGISRKSMLGAITDRAVEDRMAASVAAALIAVERGARIVRVHDVAETVDALKVWSAMMALAPGDG